MIRIGVVISVGSTAMGVQRSGKAIRREGCLWGRGMGCRRVASKLSHESASNGRNVT